MKRVVFVFPGQGTQWHGMGAALLEREPAFAEAVADCDKALAPLLGWSVTDALSGARDIVDIDAIQPALFALQVGLARLWRSKGVHPSALVGHSLGEVAAAHVAGALTLEQAAGVVVARSRLYRRLSGSGAMALVGLGWAQATAAIDEQDGRVCLAATNAPGSTVVAGDHDAVHALVQRLRWDDVFCRLIGADVAGHSHHVDPLLPELRRELAGLEPSDATIPLWSTVTARTGARLDAAYWCRNLREPVLFWPVIRELSEAGHDTFLELSPHPTLLSGLRETPARLLASLHQEDPGTLGASLAELRAVELEPDGVLGDHRVEGEVIVPGAAFVAAALAEAPVLDDVAFHVPLVLGSPRRLRTTRTGDDLTLTCDGVVHATARTTTPPTAASHADSTHSDTARTATARTATARTATARRAVVDLPLVRTRCATALDAGEFYARLAGRGMEYGPAFRRVETIATGAGETLVRLAGPYTLDAPSIDAALQSLAPLLDELDGLILPHRIGQIAVLGEVAGARWAHARRVRDTEFDIDVCDDGGRVVLALRRVTVRRITRDRGWSHAARWTRTAPGEGVPFGGRLHRVPPGLPAERAVAEVLELARELAEQAEPPRLWVVTELAQAVETGDAVRPGAAAVWGLVRAIRHEHPELGCTLIDLDGGPLPELWELGEENEVAYRDGQPFALRLVPRPAPRREAEPYRVVLSEQGELGGLRLESAPEREPGAGELRVRVRAAGLNFNDVLRANGMLAEAGPLAFGLECAGEVIAVGPDATSSPGAGDTGLGHTGPDATRFAVGDRVVCLVSEIGAMATHLTVDARLAARIPDNLGYAQAATLPAAYLTAVHGMAGLREGERVLVHAGAGGVGQAALHLARRSNAEVMATAGSERKRAWLREQGVRHVFDSRSTAFAGQVMEATGGRGVDMVVNCLSGEAIEAGLSVLAPFGRFVELGKRDIAENRPLALGPFARSLTFHAVEAFSLTRLRPALVGGLLREIVAAVAAGELQPLPVTVLPAAEAGDAFRHMAAARHIGKIVLTFDDAVPRADGTYLVTGGLSGLGLAAAERLARDGARHLALLGRGAPRPENAARIDALREAGVEVTVLAADVADADALAAALATLRGTGPAAGADNAAAGAGNAAARADSAAAGADSAAERPPIRGVVHAAGVLRDRIMTAMDAASLREVLRPKVDGTLNLHRLTARDPLDFFVLFSSAAGLLGSAAQTGYAAGNAFLDGFAHWRRSQGLTATSIGWGPWSQTGLAATEERAGRLALRGMGGIDVAHGLDLFAAALAERPAHVAFVPLDAPTWFAHNPGQDRWSIFAGMRGEPAASGRLEFSTPQELQEAMTAWVAGVLRTSPAAIDPHLSLTRLGLDSLMAVELRNLVESRLGVRLPTPAFLDGPSVAELTGRVLARLGEGPGHDDGHGQGDPMVARLEALSDAQVDALLDELLNNPIGGVA
ncbi:SDR family NAD(P)-dependent oxidoreductase [Nonomuraea soli]|uniref:Acyl transferase domain-containing protein/NAD(P)-dependent dehydrogenase (Short-subunit alcohol dehydrogenase family)/acyl carrier protein n=1 Tax=Nonomuraea soli TaxID=1032476 RepID=A0A7W0CSL8_9ACTN|nr:SDR family NAD(P)-dependent oxidoreductase [Nonomuraea soli]MBA2896578.1 acyl transferase domain-containing protein/NAD(P)-dependent dehydrogenase (short-subunit alcohol dehydrogenase family)/acyl carrier protein [Nonomuraea soli]